MAATSCPSVQYDGKTWVMVPHETERRHQTGNVIVISRSEVEETVASMERYQLTMEKEVWKSKYGEKLKAWKSLLAGAEG